MSFGFLKPTKKKVIWGSVIFIVLLLLMGGGSDSSKDVVELPPPPAPNDNGETVIDVPPPAENRRSFAMGFTRWPPDFSKQAIDEMWDFIDDHADLIAHHHDQGMPWVEMERGERLSDDFMSDPRDAKKTNASRP